MVPSQGTTWSLVTSADKTYSPVRSPTYNLSMFLMAEAAVATTTIPRFLYVLPLWPLLFMAIWAIWNMARDSRDAKLVQRSLAWPEAQGKVLTSKIVWAHVAVSYEYSISSGRYTGTYQRNLPVVAPDKYGQGAAAVNSEARQDLAEFPPGANVIIRYNPERPGESVLYCKGEIQPDHSARSSSAPPELFSVS
jgi:hypothetical protein